MTRFGWLRRLLHLDEHENDLSRSAAERLWLQRRARERRARLESIEVEGQLVAILRRRADPPA